MSVYIANKLNTSKIRRVLESCTDLFARYHSDALMIEGKFDDLDIRLEYENLNFLDSDSDHILDSPTLVLYSSFSPARTPSAGILSVEFQFCVSILKGQALAQLDLYTSLCRILCCDVNERYRWHTFGLTPHIENGVVSYQEFETQNGRAIHPDIQNKLLIRSIQCNFHVLGEIGYGN